MSYLANDGVKQEPEMNLSMRDKEMNNDVEEYLHYNSFDRDLKLLETYKTFPQLYDREHPDFRFASRKENAWKALSKEVGLPLETCRKRITYIRARFTVERRLIKNGQNSDWPLMEKLKFLHKHIQMRRLRDDTNDCEVDLDDDNNQASSTSLYNNHSMIKRSFYPNNSMEDDLSGGRASKRPRDMMNFSQNDDFDAHTTLSPTPAFASMPHHMPIIPEVSTNDHLNQLPRDKHAIFGEYIAEVLRKLPKQMQPQTTMKLMNVIIEAQEQELQQQQQQTSASKNSQSTTENNSK